ncbi:alpha/beta hydrolase-fold protein [Aquimarina hainanensis]|uniref:Alpha/beta hydrolase-fold protein n=1 Tax=Aquimarina hainanensis TaxID=1578017 RepID=A0ABW5N4N9_9FLAO
MGNKILLLITILSTCFVFAQQKDTDLKTHQRKTIQSDILNEAREFQVYLPPSYYFNNQGSFPVIYLMDGDYNYGYVTNLVELLSSVSGKIPEFIVVGIADKGKLRYRANCTPASVSGKNGNATNFMQFIEKELQPYIHNNYRASTYDILIGQSIGGLFVTNYLLERPETFNTYIAIDPALWLGNYEIINRADKHFESTKKLDASYFVSLADTKQMGVRQMVGILDKHFPTEKNWHFMHFENENHNSVGLLTIKQTLEQLFKNWEITRSQFYTFKSAQEIIDHYHQLSTDFDTSFSIPSYFLGNVIYYYFNHKKEQDLSILENEITNKLPGSLEDFYIQLATNYLETKQYKKALEIYQKRIKQNPTSYASYEGISKVYLAQGKQKEALEMSKKSIEIAKKGDARQWMLNELMANTVQIKNSKK